MYPFPLNSLRLMSGGRLLNILKHSASCQRRTISLSRGVLAQKDKLTRFDDVEFDSDAPLKFRGSGADNYRSHQTFIVRSGRPVSQTYWLSASIAAFLLYFCVLREENEADDRLGLSMLESVPKEYEEEVIKMARQMVLNEGGSTEELDAKLKEIKEERLALAAS